MHSGHRHARRLRSSGMCGQECCQEIAPLHIIRNCSKMSSTAHASLAGHCRLLDRALVHAAPRSACTPPGYRASSQHYADHNRSSPFTCCAQHHAMNPVGNPRTVLSCIGFAIFMLDVLSFPSSFTVLLTSGASPSDCAHNRAGKRQCRISHPTAVVREAPRA